MRTYRPAATCPSCGRTPPVVYSEAEVTRARAERAAAHVHLVQCPRCADRYWIRAREIADSIPHEADAAAEDARPRNGDLTESSRPAKVRGQRRGRANRSRRSASEG